MTSPAPMSTKLLQQARPLLNMAALARAAEIPEQTLFAKLRRGTELTGDEAARLSDVLRAAGIELRATTDVPEEEMKADG